MRRSRTRILVAVIPALYITNASSQATVGNDDILGRWKIVKHVSPPGATSSLTERDVRRLIGKQIDVSPDLLNFNGRNCSQPDYKRRVDDAADYFYREWRVDANGMPVGKRVTIIENRCGDNVLYPTSKDHMIVAEDGFFFEAVRSARKSASKSASAGAHDGPGGNTDIFGTWTIDGADWKGSGYDSEETKTKKASIFMGMRVYIGAQEFFYNQNTCKQPTYKRRREQKSTYFHGDWRATQGRLPLPTILTAVETECGTIYPIRKNLILIEDKNGMFFSAVPLSGAPAG
jgi:hypothetical protein